MKTSSLLFVLCVAVSGGDGRAVLNENGYEDLVVAISPDIPQDNAIVDKIKEVITEASRELFIATRNQAYYRRVKILLPKTWDWDNPASIQDESFETAEFRLDFPNPVYGDGPYTVQTGECGVPGSYMHLTPEFVKNTGNWGNKGKTVVHEFAKLRWGVFEEHGYPGDDKFPMFYLRTTWTIDGEKTEVGLNFCLNQEILGYEQDISTGGSCNKDANGLPDGNCYYYASQQTAATSSYMSLPYLSSNQNFCDDTENYYHDPELPNKQNLFCNGRSTWDVIQSSGDFADNANPPNPAVTDTTPEFIVVGGSASVPSYVLVMDISLSMSEKSRFQPMKDAAKRWIKFDILEGVELGMVAFADEKYVRPILNLTKVTEEEREKMLDVVEKLETTGKTCIGCALNMAANYAGLLKDQTGNTIILITDGKQECMNPNSNTCLTISDVIDDLIARKIRVITIALGDEADPEIEDLAERTGGKSYYVEDGSGAGDINDAFGGSTTYQPGDTMGDKTITVHQQDWMPGDVNAEGKLLGVFDIDATVGRDSIFQIDLQQDASECTTPILIKLVSPDANHTVTDLSFTCNKQNFGVFRHSIAEVAEVGRWIYQLEISELKFNSLSVMVTSKARSESSADPITTRCWISTGGQQLNEGVNLQLAVMAEVKQSNKPVIGAKVNALIERPPTEDGVPQPSLEVDLLDNGGGADNIKNDGIYARYFSKYTGKGRYSVKCQVVGDEGNTQVNEGFITSRKPPRPHYKAIPESPGTPMCCGSNTVFPDSKLTDTGNFTRQAAGGSFQMTEDIPTGDNIPPSRVTDLQSVTELCKGIVLQFTAPGDDLDSQDKVKEYTIKYATNKGNLTQGNFDSGNSSAIAITSEDLASGSSLSPVNGGTQVVLGLNQEKFGNNKLFFFAMKSVDDDGNHSPVSNVVAAAPKCNLIINTTTPISSSSTVTIDTTTPISTSKGTVTIDTTTPISSSSTVTLSWNLPLFIFLKYLISSK